MINDVTVCVNNIEKRSYAVLAAGRFAERHKATLTAVYIKLDTVEIVRWAGSSPINLADQILANEDKREQQAKTLFDSLRKDFSCSTTWATINQSADPIQQLICTDVIFAEQPLGDDLSYFGDQAFINHLILQTRRPIIMIPEGWQQEQLGTNSLIGWNKSPEVMRAVSDALPILQQSNDVKILQIVKKSWFQAESTVSPDIETFLLNKGIKTHLIVEAADKSATEESFLLKWAEENNVSLIVIGGYGHSRLRESVMGGMTKHLIDHSTIPVLFSH